MDEVADLAVKSFVAAEDARSEMLLQEEMKFWQDLYAESLRREAEKEADFSSTY